MCLILLACRMHPRYPLVIAANRDEFHSRPTAGAHAWQVPGGILAGRDLEAGGTWLGVNPAGCFAAVTNISEIPEAGNWLSRGDLVADFLGRQDSAPAFAAGIAGDRYRGFNLLLWDGETLVHTSNRSSLETLAPGIYGIANAGLDESRFKVRRGTDSLRAAIGSRADDRTLIDSLFTLLSDATTPATPERRAVPGMTEAMQLALGACFIKGETYGTRASTVVLLDDSECIFTERVYAPRGLPAGSSHHTLPIAAARSRALDSSREYDAD